MDFFQSQDNARRRTGRLIVLFALAVISLVMVTNLLVMLLLNFLAADASGSLPPQAVFDLPLFATISLAVVAVVLFGSLYKMASLSGGGARVAEMLDGRLLLPDSEDFHVRRVLNVVEEMALASATPVPPVYLLEESGINAFAAGYAPGDAVIGITRGALESLTRDELQGVIAHEFSHILNGDMRLNIRLIAVLHGILILGIIGYQLMRGGAYSRRSKNSGGVVALGLGLMVVGYVGTFFGNLIKAAVSRQREFLADASAVQYTRNPDGIGGALMRIATHESRSYLDNPSGAEINHALFEEGAFTRLRALYATHPPINDRIRAILPGWDGQYRVATTPAVSGGPLPATGASGEKQEHRRQEAMLVSAVVAERMISQIGQPGPGQLEQARNVLQDMPEPLLAAAHDPSGARALVYLLLLDSSPGLRARQLELLARSADQAVGGELEMLLACCPEVAPAQRLPLLLISIGTMRQLSGAQYARFADNLDRLIKLDSKINLMEWAVQRLVLAQLDPVFGQKPPVSIGTRDLAACTGSVSVLLSVLAHSDPGSSLGPGEAIRKAATGIAGVEPGLRDKQSLGIDALNAALDELREVMPLQKPALLKACAAVILADERLTAIELELLRAIGATLDCPIPPLALSGPGYAGTGSVAGRTRTRGT